MSEEEIAGDRVVKFATVVTLDRFDGAPKLSENVGKKIRKGGKCIRLKA